MAADSVERIGIDGETPEGRNSAYLIDDRVVVDPGPPTEDAWADLRAGLERAGVAVTDLETVLVTHWHADHAGLAPRLADAAGASIAMGAGDAPLVEDYAAERTRRLERDHETMCRWGVPDDAVDRIVARDTPSPMPDSVPVNRLAGGDRVAGLEVVPTPGHTLGHTAFAWADVLFVGDAILPTYTPNVGGSDTRTLAGGATPATGASTESGRRPPVPDPLATFLETLERLEERPERLLPGHGTTIDPDRIDEIRAHHRSRSRRVLDALRRHRAPDGRDGTTPWRLAVDLFGDLEGIHVKFGAGEVAAHCRRLERDGIVDRVDDDPVRYEP